MRSRTREWEGREKFRKETKRNSGSGRKFNFNHLSFCKFFFGCFFCSIPVICFVLFCVLILDNYVKSNQLKTPCYDIHARFHENHT
jgi:hypothetical protein